jgi:hypothetical protein
MEVFEFQSCRLTTKRIKEPRSEPPTGETAKLHAVGIDQKRTVVSDQHIGIVKVTNDHTGCVQGLNQAVQLFKQFDDLVTVNTLLRTITLIPVALQLLCIADVRHGVTDNQWMLPIGPYPVTVDRLNRCHYLAR